MSDTKETLMVIFQNEHDKLMVQNDPQGKILVYMTTAEDGVGDAFSISISKNSLNKLCERAARNVFTWTITDNSLEINGKNGLWELVLERQDNHKKCRIFPNLEETVALKNALFNFNFMS